MRLLTILCLVLVAMKSRTSLAHVAELPGKLQLDEPRVLLPTLIALCCLVAAQAVFWIWTYPADQATGNWTVQPENWEILRRNWEYSHCRGGLSSIGNGSTHHRCVAREPSGAPQYTSRTCR